MIETIDICDRSIAKTANMLSDWLLRFYILHVIANGLSLWLLRLRRIVPEEGAKASQWAVIGSQCGKSHPKPGRWSQKAGVSYGGQPPGAEIR